MTTLLETTMDDCQEPIELLISDHLLRCIPIIREPPIDSMDRLAPYVPEFLESVSKMAEAMSKSNGIPPRETTNIIAFAAVLLDAYTNGDLRTQ